MKQSDAVLEQTQHNAKYVVLCIRMSADELALIKKLAHDEERSCSQLARLYLRKGLAEHPLFKAVS